MRKQRHILGKHEKNIVYWLRYSPKRTASTRFLLNSYLIERELAFVPSEYARTWETKKELVRPDFYRVLNQLEGKGIIVWNNWGTRQASVTFSPEGLRSYLALDN